MVEKILVCSTGHVTRDEAEQLDRTGYTRGEYGWLIAIGDFPIVPEIEPKSAGFTWIIAFAKGQGCAYVLFDRDAAPIGQAELYEW